MDLIYENLTFHGILFLIFSILNLSHPVTNALEILSFLEVLKLHFITFFGPIFLVVIHQPRASFFPVFDFERPGLEPTMDHIEGDHANNHTTGVVQMFVVSFVLNMLITSKWYQVKSAPGHFDTYLSSQISTYSNINLVISAPNVWLFLFNYVD